MTTILASELGRKRIISSEYEIIVVVNRRVKSDVQILK